MSSVESLARWLSERPKGSGPANKILQIRLDEQMNRQLAYLARRFGMPKATLAQELLGAAIKDTLSVVPGNVRAGDVLDGEDLAEFGLSPGDLVHEYGPDRDDDDEPRVKEVS